MGDVRYERFYEAIERAADRAAALRELGDEDVVAALAAAASHADALLANVLATEALNRVRRLRAALANLGEGVLALGPDGSVHWVNPAAERLLQLPRERVVGRAWSDVVAEFDAGRGPVLPERSRVLLASAAGLPSIVEGDWWCTSEGHRFCVAYTSAPILGPSGEVEGAVVAFRDWTESVERARALRESRELYKSLFDLAPDPIICIGSNGAILDANEAAIRLTDRPIEETRGHSFTEYLHPDDVAETLALFAEVVAGNRREAYVRIRRRDGSFVTTKTAGVPVIVDGSVVGLHAVVRETSPDREAARP